MPHPLRVIFKIDLTSQINYWIKSLYYEIKIECAH